MTITITQKTVTRSHLLTPTTQHDLWIVQADGRIWTLDTPAEVEATVADIISDWQHIPDYSVAD